jgi:hypothetical protein
MAREAMAEEKSIFAKFESGMYKKVDWGLMIQLLLLWVSTMMLQTLVRDLLPTTEPRTGWEKLLPH